jgi:hypothetical protein
MGAKLTFPATETKRRGIIILRLKHYFTASLDLLESIAFCRYAAQDSKHDDWKFKNERRLRHVSEKFGHYPLY